MKTHQKKLFSLILVFAVFLSSFMGTVSAETKSGESASDWRESIYISEPQLYEVSEYGRLVPVEESDAAYVIRETPSAVRKAARSLPSSYNLVDSGYMTNRMENQGSWGTCWTFGALGAAESSLYEDDNDIDLSQRHLAYFTYCAQPNPDRPEDGTDGDAIFPFIISEDNPEIGFYMGGGNDYYAIATLARGIGAELEEKVPYPTIEDFRDGSVKDYYIVDESERFASAYQLKEALFLPWINEDGEVDTSFIKNMMYSEKMSLAISYFASEEDTLESGLEYHEVKDSGYWTYYTCLLYTSRCV